MRKIGIGPNHKKGITEDNRDELRNELYYNAQKNFPGQLRFPERFNLKFDEKCFKEGRSVARKDQSTLFFPQDEEAVGRLALVLKNNLPKAFRSPKYQGVIGVCGELYDNLQFGYYCEEKDIEYYFHFYTLTRQAKIKIETYDQDKEFTKGRHEFTLRSRIQYATRYTNSAGAYFELWGYLYIPKKDQDPFGYPKRNK